MSLHRTEPQRFQPNTSREAAYLAQIWGTLATFAQNNGQHFRPTAELDYALAMLATQSKQQMLYHPDVIKYYQTRSEAVQVLAAFVHQHCPEVDR